MNFKYGDGNYNEGDVIVVKLDKQANVILLDPTNFSNFKNGRKYSYYGGLAKVSPFEIIVPRTGHWYLVVNLGGYAGTVNYSVSVISNS
ncbi:DUF1883 domain-containing protein [Clostridium sulfidigenes]|uniref:DUF1883 domain-containing protein n=1 Tax=Clostridium sulfidigenes TaxID=318464 RepID=UPI003F88A50E